jgi:hypothetical protein
VAAQAGRSEAYVSKRMRVFEDAGLREAVERQRLSVSVAEELLAMPVDERPALVAQAIAGGWDRRRVREAVRGQLEPAPEPPGVVISNEEVTLIIDSNQPVRPVWFHPSTNRPDASNFCTRPVVSEA